MTTPTGSIALSLCCCLVAATNALAQSPAPPLSPPTPTPTTSESTSVTPPGDQPVSPSPGAEGTPPSDPVTAADPKKSSVERPDFEPTSRSNDNRVYLENADRLRLDDNDVATATGNVRIRYRDYIVSSGKAVIDTKSGVAVFSQGVTLYSAVSSLNIRTATPESTIQMDLRRGTYQVIGTEKGVIPPSQIPASGVVTPVYIGGGDINGQPQLIDARLTSVTTCEFEQPHYTFLAQTVKVRPGKRIVARRVTIYRHGHRLLTIPLIVLPLNDRYERQQYIPQIGSSPDEGYYAKFGIPYDIASAAIGLGRVDLMQKKGVGLGFDQQYRPLFGKGGRIADRGILKVYYLNDKSTHLKNTTASLEQSQLVFSGFRLSVNSQYANNAYQLSTSSSESLSNSLSLARSTAASTTNLAANLQQSNYGFGATTNMTSSFTQHWATANRGASDLRFTYSGYQTPGISGATGANRQTLTSSGVFSTNSGGFNYALSIDAASLLRNTTGAAGIGSLERLPELSIKTDTGDPKHASPVIRLLPFLSTAGFTFGQYNDPSAVKRTQRAQLAFNVDDKVHQQKALTTSYAGSFEQDFYGDNTARYILSGRYGNAYAFGKASHFEVNYQTQRPYGYTPFLWDQTGKYDNASASLRFQPSRSVGLNLVSGYDFTRASTVNGLPAAPWQNLSAQLVVRPNSHVSTRLTSTYDINTGHLFDVSNDFRLVMPWGFRLATASRYSPDQHTWSSVTGSLTLPVMSNPAQGVGYKLEALGGYNGYTKLWTYYGAQLTRSWHDLELSGVLQNNMSANAAGTAFYFNLRLKAFPGIQPFGVGQFGQGISTGSSDVF
ncbi:MAG TPA: hypothetical protein VGK19_08840 [Capsulimonadaceae bacterium]|jgi:hypothetical protein